MSRRSPDGADLELLGRAYLALGQYTQGWEPLWNRPLRVI